MKRIDSCLDSRFRLHISRDGGRCTGGRIRETVSYGIGEIRLIKLSKGDWIGPCTSGCYHLTPEGLAIRRSVSIRNWATSPTLELNQGVSGRDRNSLSKERNDCCRLSVPQAACCSTGAAVVNDGGNVLEEPFMGTVSDEIHIFIGRSRQVRPSFGHYRSSPGSFYCSQDSPRGRVGIVEYDTTESEIDWLWSSSEEVGQVSWWFVVRCFTKEEANNI